MLKTAIRKSLSQQFLLIVISIICLNFSSICDKIYFTENTMEFALTKAKAEEKLVFVFLFTLGEKKADFFQSGVFYKEEVCTLFNENFVNLKAKADTNIGQALIKKHQITTTPCFLIFDPNGQLKAQTSSIKSTTDLLSFAKEQL